MVRGRDRGRTVRLEKKDAEDKEEIYGCGERGQGVCWCGRRGCRGLEAWMEADDWMWPPLAGTAQRKTGEDNNLFRWRVNIHPYMKGQRRLFSSISSRTLSRSF